jgi:hypothetical protein
LVFFMLIVQDRPVPGAVLFFASDLKEYDLY